MIPAGGCGAIRQLRGLRRQIAHGALHVDKIMFPKFIRLSNRPPNSPDLNPVDYSIWGALQQLIIKDIDHLNQVLNSC